MPLTFAQLLERVKTEARVKSSDNLDGWIKGVINEIYKDYCENNEYSELLVPNAVLPPLLDAQSQVPLPVDSRKLVSVEFTADSETGYFRELKPRNMYRIAGAIGSPVWFYEAGGNLHIYPASLVDTRSQLRITYYRRPPDLVADGDKLLVSSLESVIIKETIARVLRYHSADRSADTYVADANRSYVRGAR